MTNLANLILNVSDFMKKNPDIKELDLNPIFAYKDGAVAGGYHGSAGRRFLGAPVPTVCLS